MKRKMISVLAAALACSFSITAVAAPSPSIVTEPVAQTIVSTPVLTNGAASETMGIISGKSAVLSGTVFKTRSGQTIDPAAVSLVVETLTKDQAQKITASLVNAIVTPKLQILNFTGKNKLYLTDSQNRVVVINTKSVSLRTAAGEIVGHNGSISVAFNIADILGGYTLAQGETIQAIYRRADGTWIAVPVIIKDDVISIALPAFSTPVNVTFLVVKGESLAYIPEKTGKSPNT